MKPGFAPWPIRLRARLCGIPDRRARRARLGAFPRGRGARRTWLRARKRLCRRETPAPGGHARAGRRSPPREAPGISEFPKSVGDRAGLRTGHRSRRGRACAHIRAGAAGGRKRRAIRSPCRRRRRWRDAFRTARGFANCERSRRSPLSTPRNATPSPSRRSGGGRTSRWQASGLVRPYSSRRSAKPDSTARGRTGCKASSRREGSR